MRFGDKFRFALHNIWNAKSRNFLTILIVFIVSLLILVIGISCINVAINITAAMKITIKDSSGYFNLRPKAIERNNNTPTSYKSPTISNEEYDKFVDQLKDSNYFESVTSTSNDINLSLRTNNNYIYANYLGIADYRFGYYDNNNLLEQGRVWQATDSGTPKAYINKNLLENIEQTLGKTFGIGDKISFNLQYDDKKNDVKVEIIGILTSENAAFSDGAFYKTPDILFDYTYLRNLIEEPFLDNCKVNFLLPNSKYNFNATITELMSMTKEINKQFETGANETRVYNNLVSTLQTTNIINIAIISLGIILGFIVLLLSIGSVSNTIIISIDKNKRFTGLMMAMGMKHKNVKSIVRTESTITIFIGILLSTLLCYCLTPVFNNVLAKLFSSILFPPEIYTFKFSIPIYFPIGVAIVFALMTTIFTRGGLRKLGKLDPITVISEVS